MRLRAACIAMAATCLPLADAAAQSGGGPEIASPVYSDWRASITIPESRFPAEVHAPIVVPPTYAREGALVGFIAGAVAGGVLGGSTCSDGGGCGRSILGIGLLGGLAGGVIGGFIGGAISKDQGAPNDDGP